MGRVQWGQQHQGGGGGGGSACLPKDRKHFTCGINIKPSVLINSFIVCLQRSYYVLLLKLWVNKAVDHLSSLHSKFYFVQEI